MSGPGSTLYRRRGGTVVLAVLLITVSVLPTLVSAGSEPIDTIDFQRRITAPGADERLSHNASTGKPVYTESPHGTDRVRVHVEWRDGGTDRLRVAVYEGGDCGVDCPYRDPWNASGEPPIALTFDAPQDQELSVEVSASEGPQIQRTVAGEIVFLADREATVATDEPDAGAQARAEPTETSPVGTSGTAIGAGVAVLAGIAAAAVRLRAGIARRWHWVVPLWSLFSRHEKEDLLDHALRRRILDTVEDQPGIHLEALVRDLDAGRGQLDRHLTKLVDADLLVEEIGHGYRAYFRPGDVRPQVRQALLVLKTGGARCIVETLADTPMEGIRAIARETGLAPSTVSYHVARLRDHGLVRERAADEPGAYAVSELARQALDHRQD